MFTKNQTNKAYAATKELGNPIARKSKNAGKLTLEQVNALEAWVSCQASATFEDLNGRGFPLQAILDLWHASIVYETLEDWFEADERGALDAYLRICKKHRLMVQQ